MVCFPHQNLYWACGSAGVHLPDTKLTFSIPTGQVSAGLNKTSGFSVTLDVVNSKVTGVNPSFLEDISLSNNPYLQCDSQSKILEGLGHGPRAIGKTNTSVRAVLEAILASRLPGASKIHRFDFFRGT